ncbi:putative toxin-antitoxin system toxin component, PIN family [Spirosoma rhododendri]|uniref:Putative toxin-antitoxin system toxin component, PIN family n=1 Tax=Spirosoma rhododendri TaxID=2728024 RepID=A0A7L5DJS3_9BACT|nr:putative toxin-antitoxin system toxin component, PIN family [Spirosoma rhododendri]QJD78704.1 putative toxin-antitoxin system toxin component, PIN family [Spirosoma rhododendri]
MKIVLDTNCLLVSISTRSPYHWLFQAIRQKRFDLYISNEILTEYVELIDRYFSPVVSEPVYQLLTQSDHIHQVDVFFHWPLITNDPDDDKFVDCAFAANVDFIVTEDKHYEVLATVDFPRLEVINLDVFKSLLDKL